MAEFMYICFFDFEKAFDSFNVEAINSLMTYHRIS